MSDTALWIASEVRELAEVLTELAGDLGARAVRQRAADRSLAVAARISGDGGPSNWAIAAAVLGVRMVATDLMVFAGIELEVATAAVREGIQSQRVAVPPTTVPVPFGWLRWLRMPFARNR